MQTATKRCQNLDKESMIYDISAAITTYNNPKSYGSRKLNIVPFHTDASQSEQISCHYKYYNIPDY